MLISTGLPQRRRVGLAVTTPLPQSAAQAAMIAILMRRFARVRWTTAPEDAARLLAYLREEL